MEPETRVESPFGDWLVGKLHERGVSLSDVARLARCDYTYLWRLVNVGRARGRQYRRPSYDMAERVGRALGATHEALTAAGYLPAENVQNSRVVDALERVERQLSRLREELSGGMEALPGDGAGGHGADLVVPGTRTPGRPADGAGAAGCRSLPLVQGETWPEDPESLQDRIELPEWLAAQVDWAVRVTAGSNSPELRPGDLALIRRSPPRPGQLAVVLRRGKLDFVMDAGGAAAVGTVVALVRHLE